MSSSDEASASSQPTGSPLTHRLTSVHCEHLSGTVGVQSYEDCEGGDGVCCDCVRLVESVRVMERSLADRDRVIAQLREENRCQAAELLEVQLQEVGVGWEGLTRLGAGP